MRVIRFLLLINFLAVMVLTVSTYAQQGACCLEDGTCVDEIGNVTQGWGFYITTQQQCEDISDGQGQFNANMPCPSVTCSPTGGACCLPNGSCVMAIDAMDCDNISGGLGTFHMGEQCLDSPCCDCEFGTQKIVIQLAGTKDNFVQGERSFVIPGSSLEIWLQNRGQDGEWLFFDSTDYSHPDQLFGHSFVYPWRAQGRCILGATLCGKARAVKDYVPNDGITLKENGFEVWRDDLAHIKFVNGGINSWVIGDELEFCLDLANLPSTPQGWPTNVLGTLNDGDLDIMMDADSEWDYLELTVVVCDSADYFKAGWDDYCPNGMPDFSQRQDFDMPHDGIIDDGFDGPTALANCFWWFDSKFEPNTTPPPANIDNYPLVSSYGSWDDHDPQNTQLLIKALSNAMNTNTSGTGTVFSDFHAGVSAWLSYVGLQNNYFVNSYSGEPIDLEWEFLAHEIERSQDVILQLGFYFVPESDPMACCRIGGHFVTAAGVDVNNRRIALSDPYIDGLNPSSSASNDASNVCHDFYYVIDRDPYFCLEIGLLYELDNYPADLIAWDFWGENGSTDCAIFEEPGTIHTIIEMAEIICPMVDTCTYYKPGYDDYCPYGMPDFDQRQDSWFGPTLTWSFDGPTALANCFWWFDSKFEPNTSPPPYSVIDNYPLVYDVAGVGIDDHDHLNVLPFISALAGNYCTQATYGTSIVDLETAANDWLNQRGLLSDYTVTRVNMPTFENIRDEVLLSQNVILLLGFYEEVFPIECIRLGGHYVTVAGVCDNQWQICISDPFFDKNEPPPPSPHGPYNHNDAKFISGPHYTNFHDAYDVIPASVNCSNFSHPPSVIELVDYDDSWPSIGDFYSLNQCDPAIPSQPWQGGDIHTLVDAALIICPTSKKCGDANNDNTVNVADAVWLINYIFKGGPPPNPFCAGDANGDGNVNVGDAVYVINYVFKGGPAPAENCCP